MPPRGRAFLLTLLITLATLFHAPALTWGFYADDYGQQLVLEGASGHTPELTTDPSLRMRPWSLFDFGDAPTSASPLHELGFYPWWTPPDWHLRFFRPLASLTHWADHLLFGRAAALHHAMSLAYFTLLLALLHALYRAAELAPRTALLALAIFGFDDSSLVPVAWLANRNALLEAVFAVAAALVAMRTRARPTFASIAAAYALALGACLSKESGIAALLVVALIFATTRRESATPARSRAAAFAGLALAVGYLGFLLAADFGSRSAFYPTPWFESSLWLARAAQLAAFAPLSFAAPDPFDLAIFNPTLFTPWLAVSIAFGVPLVLWTARQRRLLPHASVFAAWVALTLLPQAGAPPSERLLFVPMVGAAPWLAVCVERAFTASSWRARVVPTLLGLTTMVLSGLSLVARGLAFPSQGPKPILAAVLSAATPHARAEPTTVVVLQSPSQFAMLTPSSTWIFATGDRTVRFAPLQWGRRAVRWHTLDDRTFELTSLDEPFLESTFEPVFLSSSAPIAAGTRWRAAAFEVEALEPAGRGLRTIRVRLDAPLDDPRWRLVTWRAGRFEPFTPPPAGASIDLPRCDPLAPWMP